MTFCIAFSATLSRACIARIPPVEYSAMSISVSITSALALHTSLFTSRCDLRRLCPVSCSKEEKMFGAGGSGCLEAVMPEEEGEEERGGLFGGSGVGVPNSGGDDVAV